MLSKQGWQRMVKNRSGPTLRRHYIYLRQQIYYLNFRAKGYGNIKKVEDENSSNCQDRNLLNLDENGNERKK